MSIGYQIGQPVKAQGDFDVGGDLTVNGAAGFSGTTTFAGGLNVTHNAHFYYQLAVDETLTVNSGAFSTDINGKLTLLAGLSVEETPAFIAALNEVPDGDDLALSQLVFYLDQSNDKLKVKVKYSGGTVKVGEIALTTP